MPDDICRVLKSDLIDIANAIRQKRGTISPIPFTSFKDEILAISGGSGRPTVPQMGTWQLKSTPHNDDGDHIGLLMIGHDDDTSDEIKIFRMVNGYGYKMIFNTEAGNLENRLSNDADSANSRYPSGTESFFPNGATVTDFCKYVEANDLGEIAQHDLSAYTLWNSALLDTYLDTFYSTYITGGGVKSRAEFKQAILDKYASTDIQQGASRVAEQRAILEDTLGFFIMSIGVWGGNPSIVIDNITVGDMNNMKCGYNTLSRGDNYYADSILGAYGVQTKGDLPYRILRSSSWTAANAAYMCEELYKDGWCAEIFCHQVILHDTQEEWEDLEAVLDAIKVYTDADKIKVITRKELYEMGEFVSNPIKSVSLTTDAVEYQIGATITEANFVCKATLNDNTKVNCESDRILDLSDVDTTTAGAYTVTMWYRGFKTTCTVTVVSGGITLPEYVQQQTSGYYQTFRFTNDTDKCYCIYLTESSNGFNGDPYTYGGAWIWKPNTSQKNMRIYYSADGSATWTELCNKNSPASLKSNTSTYFGEYTFGGSTALTLNNVVHITS